MSFSRSAKIVTDVMSRAINLPQTDIAQIQILLCAGEEIVAIENLCEQLYEYEVLLAERDAAQLRELRRGLGVDEKF
jgi:hypothetical protein